MMMRLIYHPAPAHALASSTAQQCAHRTAPILLHPIRRRRHPDITAPACGLRGTARPRAPPTPTPTGRSPLVRAFYVARRRARALAAGSGPKRPGRFSLARSPAPLAPGFARPAARRGTESARRETCAPSPGDAARAGGPVSFISLSLPNHEQRERASKQPIRDRVQKQARCFVRARPFSPPCVVLAQSACVCSV